MTTPPAHRPVFTLTEAATLVGVSRSTIRRRREANDFPDSYKTRDGQWMIPLENLLAKGLRPLSSEQAQNEPSSHGLPTALPSGLDQAARLSAQAELAQAREALNLAERDLAVERAKNDGLAQTLHEARQRANDLSMALRQLESSKGPIAMGPAEHGQQQPAPAPTQPATGAAATNAGAPAPAEAEPRRRGFWSWLVGD